MGTEFFMDDLFAVCGSGRLGTSCHSLQIIGVERKNYSWSISAKVAKTRIAG